MSKRFLPVAQAAKAASTRFQALPGKSRTAVLDRMRQALLNPATVEKVLRANEEDVAEALKNNTEKHLVNRLKLTPAKLSTLAKGMAELAAVPDPIGEVLSEKEITPGFNVRQEVVPLGVLLIVFESRPDALPQIISLAVRSGNAVVLKGGKEAVRSNTVIHEALVAAATEDPDVPAETIQLVHGREAIGELLAYDKYFSLVIPRGSNSLVQSIQRGTMIPVMGHADGICHVYVDKAADPKVAVDVAVDSKIDYPAACNAMETLLLHQNIASTIGAEVISALQEKGVEVLRVAEDDIDVDPDVLRPLQKVRLPGYDDLKITPNGPSHEYGSMQCAVAVVPDVARAQKWIQMYGSAHTDTIVTTDTAASEQFRAGLDSACVFQNATTRFADGFRFGLGAEVGVATGRLHARGPVGVRGLLTYRWAAESSSPKGHTLAQFNAKEWEYTHKTLK